MERKFTILKRGKQSLLSLEGNDSDFEDRYEIEFLLSLTPVQRYSIMKRLVRQGKKMLEKNDHKNTPSLVTRT